MRLLFMLAMLLSVDIPLDHAQPPNSSAASSPNIVVIMVDDMNPSDLNHMPRTLSLVAKQGVRFERAFAAVSTCCPSRASVLTGKYAHNHRVYTNHPDKRGAWEAFRDNGNEQDNLALHLQRAGYRTALIGKYLNNYGAAPGPAPTPPGWDFWRAMMGRGGYDQFNYAISNQGVREPHGSDPEDYFTDVISGYAAEFVKRSAADGAPFFALLTPTAPHDPAVPAPRHADVRVPQTAPRSPNFDEIDVSDKPAWVRALPPLYEEDLNALNVQFRSRVRSLMAVDEMVGRMVHILEEAGALDNTYIVVLSDNGLSLGAHRRVNTKLSAYDEDIRVPLLIRGPGVPQDRVRYRLVSLIDLAPTFLDWAGAPVPASMDGISLAPVVTRAPGDPGAWRDVVLVEHWQANDKIPEYAALRSTLWSYVKYATGEREFYDLKVDPHQLRNVAGTLAAERVRLLDQRLVALQACAGATCR